MITRPGRQAPIGEMALDSVLELNSRDKNLSYSGGKTIKSYPDQ